MNALKTLFFVALALGLTWAAEQVTSPIVAQATGEAPATEDVPDPSAGSVSAEEIDAELDAGMARIDELLDTDDTDEAGQFIPAKPLPADSAVDLLSDI